MQMQFQNDYLQQQMQQQQPDYVGGEFNGMNATEGADEDDEFNDSFKSLEFVSGVDPSVTSISDPTSAVMFDPITSGSQYYPWPTQTEPSDAMSSSSNLEYDSSDLNSIDFFQADPNVPLGKQSHVLFLT